MTRISEEGSGVGQLEAAPLPLAAPGFGPPRVFGRAAATARSGGRTDSLPRPLRARAPFSSHSARPRPSPILLPRLPPAPARRWEGATDLWLGRVLRMTRKNPSPLRSRPGSLSLIPVVLAPCRSESGAGPGRLWNKSVHWRARAFERARVCVRRARACAACVCVCLSRLLRRACRCECVLGVYATDLVCVAVPTARPVSQGGTPCHGHSATLTVPRPARP